MPISTIGQNGLNAPITLTSPVINTVTSAASTALTLQSAGTTGITVDTSQNVGIGTASPSTKLSVRGTASMAYGNASASFSDNVTGTLYVLHSSGQVFVSSDTAFAFGSGPSATERMRISSGGTVYIKCTADPSASVFGSAFINNGVGAAVLYQSTSITSANALQVFYNPNGNVGSVGTSGSNAYYSTTSDYRLKENITPMTGALAKIAQLNPVNYKWKADGSDGEGFIAHELEEVCPQAVVGGKDAVDAEGNPVYQSIDTSFLVATLTAAIQELAAKNDALTARIVALENR